jgi:hypothetical protein
LTLERRSSGLHRAAHNEIPSYSNDVTSFSAVSTQGVIFTDIDMKGSDMAELRIQNRSSVLNALGQSELDTGARNTLRGSLDMFIFGSPWG